MRNICKCVHRVWQALGVHVSSLAAVMELHMLSFWLKGASQTG